jgi:bifunctional ADP-heptose synthase (sugar kinase/adenylyltransferase)
MKIAIVGDVIVDYRRLGHSSRVSPEDPNCKVLSNLTTVTELGGASNVAYWIATQPNVEVQLFGHYGIDETGFHLTTLCRRYGIRLSDLLLRKRGDYHTTNKERICLIDDNHNRFQQLVRCDRDTNCVLGDIEFKLIRNALEAERFDMIIVADYGKGMFGGAEGRRLREWIARSSPSTTIVNSKTPSVWDYAQTDVLICNHQEAFFGWNSIEVDRWHTTPNTRCFVVTEGERGVSCNVLTDSNSILRRILKEPTLADTVLDVTGAGDALTAGFAYEYLRRSQLAKHAMLDESEIRSCINQGQRWAAHCVAQIGCGQPLVLDAFEDRDKRTEEHNVVAAG